MKFRCSSAHMTSRKNWKKNWVFNSRYICMILSRMKEEDFNNGIIEG